MRILKSVILVFSLLSANMLMAEQADDPNTFQVETTTMKMNPGKNLEDLLAIRSKFAKFAKSGDLKFGSVVLVPWAVSKAAFPDNQDWDALWVGYSPNTADYAGALSYYLENGSMINADFDSVRTNVQVHMCKTTNNYITEIVARLLHVAVDRLMMTACKCNVVNVGVMFWK